MAYRLAGSLVQFRHECNLRWPGRDKASDGWIGDAAHASRTSDHNPWVKDNRGVGVVRAYDLDAGHGAGREVSQWLAEHLRHLGSIGHIPLRGGGAYVISDRRIASRASGWRWRYYGGSNPHTSHTHVSVSTSQAEYDTDWSWAIGEPAEGSGGPPPPPGPPAPPDGGMLRRGSKGDEVRTLQRVLNAWYPWLRLAVDGDFGPATEAGVKELQRRAGLAVDGIVGPRTKAVLHL